MITKTKNIQIVNNGSFPYSYEWILNDICVSVNQLSGTISEFNPNIVATFEFSNSQCLTDANVQLRLTDNNRCSEIFPINFSNGCDNFILSDIQQQLPYTFSVSALSGGTPPFTYNWSFNDISFDLVSEIDNSITLVKTANTNQDYIYVTVTDAEGCQQNKELLIFTCKPEVPNKTVNTTCNPDNSRTVTFEICSTLCRGAEGINWNTAEFSTIPDFEYSYSYTTNNQSNISPCAWLTFNIPEFVTEGTYTIDYTARDSNGELSNTGQIDFIIQPCNTQPPIIIIDQPPFQIDCDSSPNSTFEIDISNLVQSTNPVDWDSFRFIVGNMITTDNPIDTLLTGAQAEFDPITKIITYTLPNLLAGVDAIEFIICDVTGQCANSAIYTIIASCSEPPLTNDDNFCASCGEPLDMNVLDNDVITGAISSINIIQNVANGNLVINPDFSITYTANNDFVGTDTFTYTVTNTNGEVSNESEVSILVICAGQNNNIAVC